nr:protein-export chaperone SecB [Arboricoccus pini]
MPQQGAAADQQNAPRLAVLTQYIKDLSFENPRAPQTLVQGQSRPEIQIAVDVNVKQIGQEQYEVVLDLKLNAKSGDTTVFVMELSYGSLFNIANIPDETMQAILLIECPRLIFPFARRIVADVTRDGGLPPLMLEPIDFVALYRNRLEQMQGQTAGEPPVGHA